MKRRCEELGFNYIRTLDGVKIMPLDMKRCDPLRRWVDLDVQEALLRLENLRI